MEEREKEGEQKKRHCRMTPSVKGIRSNPLSSRSAEVLSVPCGLMSGEGGVQEASAWKVADR